jgi:hypothetical protein
MVAVAVVGGAAIVAGGAVAAGAMQSDATRRANASSTKATKEYMKLASKEADLGYGDMMAAVNKLGGSQTGLSKEYYQNTDKTVKAYDLEVNKALGGGTWEKRWVPETITGEGKNQKTTPGYWEEVFVPKDYNTGVEEVLDKAEQNVAGYKTRSENLIKESADQTYDYNLSRFDDFADFATRLSEENQKIRLNLARAATPMFDETRSQMALNDLQLTQGIVPASVQAEIERSAAQRGLASGVGAGSQLKNNLSMRDLGLSSYAGIQQGQQNFQNRQLQDYNTLVAGTQVGVNDVYNWMGLNVNKVIDVNNENSWKLFEAQKVPLDYKMVGLNTTLDKRFDLATNKASFYNAAFSNIYGQESDTARTMAALEAAAAEARTNAKLGIAGQGLTNAYNNANRTMASGLANAQLVSNASSTIGGSLMGAGMAGAGGGGGGWGGGGANGAGAGSNNAINGGTMGNSEAAAWGLA